MNYLDDTNSNRIKRKSAFINIYILFFYETIARCFLFNSEDLLDDIMTFDDLHYLHFFFLFSLEMIAEPLIWDLQLYLFLDQDEESTPFSIDRKKRKRKRKKDEKEKDVIEKHGKCIKIEKIFICFYLVYLEEVIEFILLIYIFFLFEIICTRLQLKIVMGYNVLF